MRPLDIGAAILGTPPAAQQAFPGAAEMLVVRNDAGGLFVALPTQPDWQFGPCIGQFPAGLAVGHLVLVLMVQGSVARPWIVNVA